MGGSGGLGNGLKEIRVETFNGELELGMSCFCRSSDLTFYEYPRFVTHIDDPAIAALTKYYEEVFPPSDTPGVALLDMCSSWVSHFPAGYKQERIVGMGLNQEELKANKVRIEIQITCF